MKKLIWILTLILLLPVVIAIPPGSAPAPGGNLTPLIIQVGPRTPNWQGYAGIITYGIGPTAPTTVNATGSNVSGQGLHFQIPCNNPTSITGFVLFSNSSAAPAGLVPGNLTQLDAYVPGTENGTLTFTQTSTFNFPSAGAVNNVPATHTYVNSLPQNATFREGYLNDAAGNIVFATEINFVPQQGYNATDSFSYQIMVAAPNYSTVPYYIYTDLTAVCPQPPSGGGGGGAGRCEEKWDCTIWTPCVNGIQTRECAQTIRCPYYSSGYFPPTERACGPQPAKETKTKNITIEEYPLEERLDNITMTVPDKLLAIALKKIMFEIKLNNENKVSLENLEIKLEIPELITEYLPIHQHRNIFWNYPEIYGWSLRNRIPKKSPWQIKSEKFRLSPQSTTAKQIEITPPAIFPQEIESTATFFLGDIELGTKTIHIQTEVNEFDAGYSYDADREIFTLFFIVDNRGKPAKESAFIEFGLDSKLVEYYGPYDFSADEVTIMAQEYNIGSLKGECELKAVLYDDATSNEVKKQCIISE